ncbi:MAG: VWA domain-containing protein [Pseudomonadota bacterium]
MRWADPKYLAVAAAILVGMAVAYALGATHRRNLLERIGHAPQVLRMTESASRSRRAIKAILMVLGTSLVALALARPQVERESQWRQRGIDLALVIDCSKSMLAGDVYPNRIARAKLEAAAVLERFAGNQIAVIPFAGAAAYYPLTTDQEAAKLFLHGITPFDLPPGSDLAKALVIARCLLRPDAGGPTCKQATGTGDPGKERLRSDDSPFAVGALRKSGRSRQLDDRARAIIVLGDGEETSGDAVAEAARAAELGIELFVLGIGRLEGDRVPVFDSSGVQTGWKLEADGRSYRITRLEEAKLREIAAAGGEGEHYFRANPGRMGAKSLLDALALLKEGDLERQITRKYSEAYQWLLLPAFLALVIEACVADRRRRRRLGRGRRSSQSREQSREQEGEN